MAPKKGSRKVVGTVVKTTKKIVQETVHVAVVGDTGADSETRKKFTEVPVKEKLGAESVPVVVFLPKGGKFTADKGNKPSKDGQKTSEEQRREEGKTVKDATVGAKREEKMSGRRRKRKWSNVGASSGGYKRYVYRVLKQVHPGMGASSMAMSVLEGMMTDMFERIAEEAARLSKYSGKATLSSREIQDAVRLVLPGELCKHAISEGVKAVTTYMDVGREG
ncbi:hypothetical protein KSP39_PZI008656 [Platanthera zijinensis]|uniref:Core Histone H2A/H2B/H3 domain-containing protein n=1 Tax=Platanthera zijinensis TaxID=2320716 RepID=A0AAP0BN46_9ASPA